MHAHKEGLAKVMSNMETLISEEKISVNSLKFYAVQWTFVVMETLNLFIIITCCSNSNFDGDTFVEQ